MRWLLYFFLLATAALWPLSYFSNLDLTKPVVFIAAYVGILTLGWMLSFFINRKIFNKILKLLSLIGFFFIESVKSNIWLSYDILTRKMHINPAIVAVPLDIETDFEINALASLITLTPGTLSIEVSEDRKTLYVHMMYVKNGDIEMAKKEIKNGFEKKIMELTK